MDFNFDTETITPTATASLTISGTGALMLPIGTTAQRPSAAAGWVRYNSDNNSLEFYNNGAAAWQTSGNTETNGLSLLAANGVVTRTAAGTYAARTLTAPAAGFTITNPAGTAGNPTFVLANDLAALEALASSGFAARTAADTWTTRSITGTTNQITLSNGDGVAGAPTISLPSTLVAPGSVQITTNLFQTQSTTVSAAGATQGTATALTSRYNIVTTVAASTGVILQTPTSPFGQEVYVANRGANALNIYPNTSAAIGSGAANAAVSLPVGQEATFVAISATQWHVTEPILVAGTNVTLTPGPGTLTIAAAGGSGSPGGANTNVQYNNAGVFGGSSAFNFISGANPRVDILGTIATNQLRIGGSADPSTAMVYIETNTSGAEGLRTYFNSGSAASSAWVSYAYTGAQPYIRAVDADDDPPYITFDVVGGGTYAAPAFANRFGGRGPNGGATTGFSWYVGVTEIAQLDTTFTTLPTLLNTFLGTTLTVTTGAAATTASAGNTVTVRGGAGGTTSGAGGAVTVTGGIPTAGAGGAVTISGAAGVGTNQNGGNVTITAGAATGTGTTGIVDMGATTSALNLPEGTTAQRPAASTAIQGHVRYNTNEDIIEGVVGYPAGSFGSYAGLPFSIMYRKRVWKQDEFMGTLPAVADADSFGELGWVIRATGTASNTMITAVADHPGIWSLETGIVSGNDTGIHLGTAATTGVVMANQIEYFAFLIRTTDITTMSLKVGLMQDAANTTQGQVGTNGVWFEFFPATSANLRFNTRSGSTSSTPTEIVAMAANTWYLCEAFFDGTTWTPRVNGTNYTGIATNVPTTAVTVGAVVETLTTAQRDLQIDYFAMITRELGNRY